jgi:hypothetical protein
VRKSRAFLHQIFSNALTANAVGISTNSSAQATFAEIISGSVSNCPKPACHSLPSNKSAALVEAERIVMRYLRESSSREPKVPEMLTF